MAQHAVRGDMGQLPSVFAFASLATFATFATVFATFATTAATFVALRVAHISIGLAGVAYEVGACELITKAQDLDMYIQAKLAMRAAIAETLVVLGRGLFFAHEEWAAHQVRFNPAGCSRVILGDTSQSHQRTTSFPCFLLAVGYNRDRNAAGFSDANPARIGRGCSDSTPARRP